ncbi:hypothetical protein F2P79_026008 [Pimephales promelas]|nr:hypothetical protein F2P79_026008 [Pimephales promelas]
MTRLSRKPERLTEDGSLQPWRETDHKSGWRVNHSTPVYSGVVSVYTLIYETHINPSVFIISIQSGDTFMNSPPKISDLAVNLTLTARRSLPQTHAEIEVLLFDV